MYEDLNDYDMMGVCIDQPQVIFQSIGHYPGDFTYEGHEIRSMTLDAPNGKYFTVKDYLNAVLKVEQRYRPETTWLRDTEADWEFCIDCHHTSFTPVFPQENVLCMYWRD